METMHQNLKYKTTNKVRVVTAASLFDGHDAAINVMRRIIQATGCEVIHLGHDRSAAEVVETAIQEDAQGHCFNFLSGGHNEYFTYIYDLLNKKEPDISKYLVVGEELFFLQEIEELQKYGIARLYSPDDGREMGLQGMINDLVQQADFPLGDILENEMTLLEKGDF